MSTPSLSLPALRTGITIPTRTEITARLADPAALARGVNADWAERDIFVIRPDGPVPAAVLIPLVWHEGERGPGVLLTLRSDRLSAHAGQVAFPGGRIEPGETAEAAALREAAEEVEAEGEEKAPPTATTNTSCDRPCVKCPKATATVPPPGRRSWFWIWPTFHRS